MRAILLSLVICGFLWASDSQIYGRVQAHLLIGDQMGAVRECREGLKVYPESKALQRVLVQALASSGYEQDALVAWKDVAGKLGTEEKRLSLEGLAWGVLSRAKDSDQFAVQYSALLGARMARDAEAVTVVKNSLKSTNDLMRALAIKIACQFRDGPLIDEIVRMFAQEKSHFVRLEVIRAIGFLGLKEMQGELQAIVQNKKSMAEEKACAIESLVNLYESVSEEELKGFVASKRAGLRALAPQIVLHLQAKDQLKLLEPLLSDHSSYVRALALGAFGYLDPKSYQNQIESLLDDSDPTVALTAGWAMLFIDEQVGVKVLEKFAGHELETVRVVAAAAAAGAGKAGLKLCEKLTARRYDPFVRANAAMGLILSNHRTKKACHALHTLLEDNKKLMWERMYHPFFKTLAKSQVRHIPQIPNYPAHVDQLTRLEILNVLSVQNYRKALPAMHAFLEKGEWGLTQAVCATLLGSGSFEALETVRSLLKSSDVKVRVQAALVLAFMAHDNQAVRILEEAYPKMQRQYKLTIIEALGAIGAQDSLPFLVNVLAEPFQITRVIAAASIIQCLYH